MARLHTTLFKDSFPRERNPAAPDRLRPREEDRLCRRAFRRTFSTHRRDFPHYAWLAGSAGPPAPGGGMRRCRFPLIEGQVDERDQEGAGEEQERQAEERQARDRVLVRQLVAQVDRRLHRPRRDRLLDWLDAGLAHRIIGSTAMATKSRAR